MRFDDAKSIFLQIGEYLEELILQGEYPEEERIPSVREFASRMEVNPNTVVRAYGQLQDSGIIYNQRGLGYFVAAGAADKILANRRTEFLGRELPELFRKMKILDISFEELKARYEGYAD